jgi:hypothetical protein
MARYRAQVFVQFEEHEPRYGCHFTVKVDVGNVNQVLSAASALIVGTTGLMAAAHPGHHGPYVMRLTRVPTLMKEVRAQSA